MRRLLPLLALAIAPLAHSGCAPSDTLRVTGRLLKRGAPYTAPEGQRLGVTFYVIEATGESGKGVAAGEPFAAQFNPADSTFDVPGPEGRGIPPGKYRVAIAQRLSRDALRKATSPRGAVVDRERDYLGDRFGPVSSPIVRELKSSCDLAIDLDRPES